MKVRALVAACALLAFGLPDAASATDLAGRYVVATLPAAPDAPVTQAAYAGTAEIKPRRNVSAVTWQPAVGTRKLRGLGMTDDDGALGISLSTGGAAYGVAIYRYTPGAHEWQGRWITSLDTGGVVGDIRFDDAGGGKGSLAGRHRLVCRRPGSGSFVGAVEITPKGDDFLLAFEVDRTVLYRGLGVRLGDDRLIVGWSFGSAPAVAVYRPDADGLLTGRRVSLRAGQPVVVREALAREGEEAMHLLPVAARTDPASLRASADADLEPGSPEIKAWTYDDLQARHGDDGWARRWLEEQLTPDERNLLERALHRRRNKPATAGRTIGQIIDAERQRRGE